MGGGGGEASLKEGAGEGRPALLVEGVLGRGPADTLSNGALDLPFDDGRVDHASHVLDAGVPSDGECSRLRTDLDDGLLRACRERAPNGIVEPGGLEPRLDVGWQTVCLAEGDPGHLP